MGLASFILNRDAMGHALSVNYKGNGAYPTMFGGLISIAIYFLVLA